MINRFQRLGNLFLAGAWLAAPAGQVFGQQKTPLPRYTGERVIVVGAPDRYDAVRTQIARLEAASPQSYHVVVVHSSGTGANATRDYADDLYELWRKESHSFDADRSLIVVVAMENHQVAVKPGTDLADRFGLRAGPIEHDLIRVFLPLAKEDRYPEAISTLLNAANNWIAARDAETPYVAVQIPAAQSGQTARQPATPAPSSKESALPRETAATSKPLTVPAVKNSNSVARTETATATAPAQKATSGWSPVLVVGVPVLLILGALVFWIWHLFRRSQGRVTGRIKEIKLKAVDVMDRLDGLKERLKLLPTSPEFSRPMTGETLALYTAVNNTLKALWDGWLGVMDVLDKAEKLAARSSSPLSQKTLAEAEELMTRQGSFAEIEKKAQAIAVDVDRLEHSHQAARSALEVVNDDRSRLNGGLGEIQKLGLPGARFQPEIAAIDAEIAEAEQSLLADPLGTQVALDRLHSRAQSLVARLERIVTLFGESQKVKSALDAIRRQVAGHRTQGLKLSEAGGKPDAFIDEGETAQTEAVAALEAGDPAAAAGKLDAARSRIGEAQATIEKVQKAKVSCERDLPARVRETERLRSALPQAETYQNDLERDFARSSWQAVARNLDQIQALLATFDRQAQNAAAAASRQDYLAGAAIVEELTRQQQIVLRLMSGLGEQLNSLVTVRNECRKLSQQAAARDRQVERVIGEHEGIVSDVARNSLDSAQRNKAEIERRSSAPAPDWPALAQSWKAVIEDLSIAESQAEDDMKHHEALAEEFEQVRDSASRVYAVLSSRREDRLAANQHYQAAADVLDRVGVELAEPRGRSAAMLEQIRGAAADLERAEELSREDIRLATQAQTEITEAGQAIAKARGYASMGFGVDTSGAESQLAQADQAVQNQDYEQAIRLAGSAMQLAQQSYYAAMQQSMMQETTMAAEQRRQNAQMAPPDWNGISMGAAAATAAAATILGRAAAAASAPAELESDPGIQESGVAAPSDTGVGSWSSETGQGTW